MKLVWGAMTLVSVVLLSYLADGILTNRYCGEKFVDDHEALEKCRQSAKSQMDEALNVALGLLTVCTGLMVAPSKLGNEE